MNQQLKEAHRGVFDQHQDNEMTPLQSWSTGSSIPVTPLSSTKRKSQIAEFVEHKDWQSANCYEKLLEVLFRINERNSSVNLEIYAGVIQFISCHGHTSLSLSLSSSSLIV
jgi:hypothetical protein